MVLVKCSPSIPDYKGPLSSEILEDCNENYREPLRESPREPPLLFVKEGSNSYEIEIDVPGLTNKNFHIKIDGGAMIISSEMPGTAEDAADGKLKLSIMRKDTEPAGTHPECNDRPFQFTVL